MYDQEFCKYPVTVDFGVNPYRYRPETTRGSRHLLHAILALSCHFRLRSPSQRSPPGDTIDHKNTAVVLLHGALEKADVQASGLSLLDTTLALWQVEATISALNIWRSYLTDAYQLLKLCGGVRRLSGSMKLNVQVSMLVWWDTMVSLLTREDSIFPYAYFDAVLKTEGRQPWTFYELNACPCELLVPTVQLAHLAVRDARLATQSDLVMRVVSEVELSIRSYEFPGGHLTDLYHEGMDVDEDKLHAARELYHCCEAFRYALLVYLLRVFVLRHCAEREKANVRAWVSFLARITLDHVQSCGPSAVIQKQLLFAVFLASTETRSRTHCEVARDFCDRWYHKFGYQMFATVLDMQAVWSQQDAGYEEFWWGDELAFR